jgi:pantoate--beta-alanine ligase
MRVRRTIESMRADVRDWRRRGLTVGLVPTMGALHEGHLSLVDRSKTLCDRTIVSIFVNPLQFGPDEDLDRYPRQEARDAALVDGRGADAVFAPPVDELYPGGAGGPEDIAARITVDRLSAGLCGAHRPGHFTGVATVVMKLLMITQPDSALFGEKDYQQLQVIKRMVRDLNVPVSIHGVPTVREPDGLAMSSRNAYLPPELRAKGPALYSTLLKTAAKLRAGAGADEALAEARDGLIAAGFRSVDYVSLVDADSLEPLPAACIPGRLLAAAWLGPARLIDNVPV